MPSPRPRVSSTGASRRSTWAALGFAASVGRLALALVEGSTRTLAVVRGLWRAARRTATARHRRRGRLYSEEVLVL